MDESLTHFCDEKFEVGKQGTASTPKEEGFVFTLGDSEDGCFDLIFPFGIVIGAGNGGRVDVRNEEADFPNTV
jgi:hypothetical protein